MASAAGGPAEPAVFPLFGRERETGLLREALVRAKAAHGETWALLGPGGMGKTRLLRWLEAEAEREGFEVRGGTCLRESIAPFFPFEQIFRPRAGAPAAASADPLGSGELPTVLLIEETKGRRFWTLVESRAPKAPLLLVTRERPSTLRQNRPAVASAQSVLWMTRLEGPDQIAPGALDAMAERLEQHLRARSGSIVALEGVEYLVSQGTFPPVLRLLQFLHDVAGETDGHLVLTLNPASLESREISLVESDAEVLKEASPVAAPAGPPSAPASDAPATVLLRYLSQLEAAAHAHPQLLVVDDLQWGDPASVSTFQFLARNLRGLPVLLVGAMRDDALGGIAQAGPPAIEEAREGLEREGLLRSVTLAGLGVEDAARLAASLVGAPRLQPRDPEALKALATRTHGNPYFLREIFFQMLEEGRLRRDGSVAELDLAGGLATSEEASLPETVRRLVLRRLDALTPAERAFVDAAALTGSEFDLEPVASVLHLTLPAARDEALSLQRRHRLVEPEGHRWCCAHPLVWEVTLAELPPTSRHRLGQGLAEWWVAHRPEEHEVIARLFHESANADEGRPWLVRALQEALQRFAGDTALVYLRWMAELRRGRGRPAWDELQEEVRYAIEAEPLGVSARTVEFLREELAEDPPAPLQGEILSAMAWCSRDIDVAGSETCVRRFEALLQREPNAGSPLALARISISLGQAKSAKLDHAGALTEIDRCLRYLEQCPDEPEVLRFRCNVHGQRAYCLAHLNRFPEAFASTAQGLEYASALGSPLYTGPIVNARGVVKRMSGDDAGAYEDFRETARLSRLGGKIAGVCISELNATGALTSMGDMRRAERILEEVLDLSQKFSLLRSETGVHAYLAEIALVRGDWEESRVQARIALEQVQRTGRELWRAEMEITLAAVQGELDRDATGAWRELRRILALPTLVDPEAILDAERFAGRFARRAGDLEAATLHLRRAREALEKMHTPFKESGIVEEEAALADARGDGARARELFARKAELLAAAERSWPQEPLTRVPLPPR